MFYLKPASGSGPVLEWRHPGEKRGWSLAINEEGRLSFEFVRGATETIHIQSATGIEKDTWSHIAVTADDIEIRLYVDGVPSGHAPYDSSRHEGKYSNKIHLGWSTRAAETWKGLLDELGFWMRALRPEEIREMYERRSKPPCKV
jgi:hypothetical protein